MTGVTGSAVFFDALGTLYRLTRPDAIFARVMTGLGFPLSEVDAARALGRANRWWADPARAVGRTAEEELAERQRYVELALEDLGCPEDDYLAGRLVDEAYWARWARRYEDARTALHRLHGSVRLAVLSNGGPSSLDAVRYSGLERYFEQMFAGLELGVQKPDPEAYQESARRLGVNPHDAWLVDDTPENVSGAVGAGMRAVLLDRAGEYEGWRGYRVSSLDQLPELLLNDRRIA